MGGDGTADRPAPARDWDVGVLERRLLALHNRRRIVNHVRANPGVHLRQIARDLGLAIGTAEHHLHLLVRYGLLQTEPSRHQTAYFLRDGTSPEHHRLVALLRSAPQRSVVRALLDDPDLDAPALARRVRMPPTTLAHHLQRLIADGHVEALRVGRSRLLRVARPEPVRLALRTVEEGPLAQYAWPQPAPGVQDTGGESPDAGAPVPDPAAHGAPDAAVARQPPDPGEEPAMVPAAAR